MSTIAELISNNDLDAAITAVSADVKANPGKAEPRIVLADLCVCDGDLDKADTHLKMASRLSPDVATSLAAYRNHLRGMFARGRWYDEAAIPDFPQGPTERDKLAIKVNLALRDGDGDTARAAIDELDALRGEQPVFWNDAPAADFRDLDDRLPHAIEALTTGGSYLWVDFTLIQSLEFAEVSRPRDLALRRARMTLMDGASAEVLIPATYHGSSTIEQKMGRETDWVEAPGTLMIGRGQRSFLVGDEAQTIMSATNITLTHATAEAAHG
ncbi:type VI secretion system accessory protein TagJ [Parasulfitobacter algicola]|uniref:Nitrogen fixation protein n=1 Tax=Parasulfitobacter algicola TaxID=2614809 RepID=A0ABX2ILK2_9RHOB|nr:type VI secretion system accessory protein TagJ [Sulfitobacter algicola]NSX53734.1 nitrogen fixation protein [Sulfitobacter algicola]